MKRLLMFTLIFALVLSLGFGLAFTGQGADDPPPWEHYNLNIIGFAQCTKKDATNPDCYNGNAGDIVTRGHTIFVPLNMETYDACATNGSPTGNNVGEKVTVAWLEKGVRILVSDGDSMMVVDRDATDGTAKFILPDGKYEVYARPLGKSGGCMDIDTIICYDEVLNETLQQYELVQVDCRRDLTNNQFVLVGRLDVGRTKNGSNMPHWQKATGDLLPEAVGVGTVEPGYLDFFWQIFNNNPRLLQLRFYKIN